MKDNKWARLLAYVTGLVNQQLLLQNEYLAAENRILRARLPTRLRLSDPQRFTLAKLASEWAEELWNRSPAWPNRTQYLRGTGGWLPRSSTVPDNVRIRAGHQFNTRLWSW
jgi:hypothetical protein